MTQKAIGPTFFTELGQLAALPFSWEPNGTLNFSPAMTADQIAQIEAVYAAHDPTNGLLAAYAQNKQQTLRDGGITVNVGTSSAPELVNVASDVNGRSLVSGCIQLVGLASQAGQTAPSFPWVNNDGSLLTLTGAQIMTIGLALGAFVQNTYAILGAVNTAIANGTVTTTAAIDAANWPSVTT